MRAPGPDGTLVVARVATPAWMKPVGAALVMSFAAVVTTAGHEYVVQCADPAGTAEVIRDRLSAHGVQDS